MARRRRRPNVRHKPNSVEMECASCGVTKPRDDFVNDKTRPTGKFPWCKDCVTESRRQTPKRIVGKEGERRCPVCLVGLEGTNGNRKYCSDRCKGRAQRWNLFGLSPSEYRELTSSGKCPICEKRVRRWQLDHNHTTGETTGAVCTNCNIKLLAYTYHNVEIARNLFEYLENPPVRRMFGEKRYVGPPEVSQLHRMWAWSGQGNASAGE